MAPSYASQTTLMCAQTVAAPPVTAALRLAFGAKKTTGLQKGQACAAGGKMRLADVLEVKRAGIALRRPTRLHTKPAALPCHTALETLSAGGCRRVRRPPSASAVCAGACGVCARARRFCHHAIAYFSFQGAAGAEEPLYNHQEYLLNQGTLLQRVLKEYAHFLHPTLSRDRDALWAALHDQMRWHGVVGAEAAQSDVAARVLARAGGSSVPAETLLQAACDEYDVVVFGLTFSHACGLKGFRVAPTARRAWQPVHGDRESRSLFLTHFGLNQWRSTLTLAQTLQLYEEERSSPSFSHESWCALLRRIGLYQEALDAARIAAGRNPQSDVAESVWGGVLGDLHNHAEALVHHQRQTEINPMHEQSHNGLGCALHFLENFTAAVPHYEQQLRCE